MKNLSFKKVMILVVVCIALFVVLKITDIMIFTLLTEKHLTSFIAEYVKTHNIDTLEDLNSVYGKFSAPFIAKLINLILQGVIISIISFILKKKYDKKYWVTALIIVLLISGLSNSNFHYTPSVGAFFLYIISSLFIGIACIYLSIVLSNSTN